MIKPGTCSRCGRSTITGADVDLGLDVVCDARPLTPMGEALALVSGCGTFALRLFGGSFELSRRDHFRIRGSPAGTKGVDILVRHDCHSVLTADLPRTRSTIERPVMIVELPEDPPF
jgi:hypothetical protein